MEIGRMLSIKQGVRHIVEHSVEHIRNANNVDLTKFLVCCRPTMAFLRNLNRCCAFVNNVSLEI